VNMRSSGCALGGRDCGRDGSLVLNAVWPLFEEVPDEDRPKNEDKDGTHNPTNGRPKILSRSRVTRGSLTVR